MPTKQAGTTAVHDLPTQPTASHGGSGTADGNDGEGGEEAAAACGGEVESWEDLLADTCEAVAALMLPATAAPLPHGTPRTAPDDALFLAGRRRARPPSIFVVTRGRPATGLSDGGWRNES